jgi:hypothetical protein
LGIDIIPPIIDEVIRNPALTKAMKKMILEMKRKGEI